MHACTEITLISAHSVGLQVCTVSSGVKQKIALSVSIIPSLLSVPGVSILHSRFAPVDSVGVSCEGQRTVEIVVSQLTSSSVA